MKRKRGSTSKNIFSSKTAQVTIFIIVGISILLITASVLYITKAGSKEKLFGEQKIVETRVPQAFAPLQIYTKNCLYQVGKLGLVQLGLQGGYINSEVLGDYIDTRPTESVGINLEPTKVPYWHFNSEPDKSKKVVYSSFKPELKGDDSLSIERQLENYIEENIDECLDDYSYFAELGFDVDVADTQEASVFMRSDDVAIQYQRDISVRKEDARKVLDLFSVSVPVKLKHYYEVAEKVLDAQKEFSFLERHGLELLTVYSGRDINLFPPQKEVTYELFSPLSWSETQLKQKYKTLLGSYVPMLKYLGSDNFYYSQYEDNNVLSQKFLDNMVLTLDGANDVDVRFDYHGWEPYFKTNSENGVIKPQEHFVKFEALNLGTQIYRTHYDISYPVLVSVYDQNALGGEGYNFVFALESNIRNNDPGKSDYVMEVKPRSVSNIACGDNHKDTELIKTVVVDSFSKEPVDLVKLGFSIPGMAECDIGQTNKFGVKESKYPSVYGGEIKFIKPDYLTNLYPINTYETKDNSLILGSAIAGINANENIIEMHKKVDIPVKIKKKLLQKCIRPMECSYTRGTSSLFLGYDDISCEEGQRQCFLDGEFGLLNKPDLEIVAESSISQYHDYYLGNNVHDLSDTDEAFITLERVGGFNDELYQSETQFTTINVRGSESVEISLFPGIYKLSGFLTVHEELVVPQEERCFKYSVVIIDQEECSTIEENIFEEYIASQIQWDIPETYVEITPEDLNTANGLTFFLPVQDLRKVPTKIDTIQKECGSLTCLPVVGCAFEVCSSKEISAPGIVVEDLQVLGEINELAKEPRIRRMLEPEWT